MSPKRLLAGGFLAGYFVLFCYHWVIAPAESFDLEDFLVALTAYVLFVGGTLSVPWVLLPVIANQPRRPTRLAIAVLASLLPAAVAIGGVTCVLLGWDVPPNVQLALCLSIAAWFIPTIAALASAVKNGASKSAPNAKKTNLVVVTIVSVGASLAVGILSLPIMAVAGWVTRTESPRPRQVEHAREFLLVNPELKIEPLAYYEKNGMDYMVRFKFLAKTDDATNIFDRTHVAPSTFGPNFDFPAGEATHSEAWWDVSSRPMSGGHIRVPYDHTLTIGYVENDDSTITVYAWRHEGAFELTASNSSGD